MGQTKIDKIDYHQKNHMYTNLVIPTEVFVRLKKLCITKNANNQNNINKRYDEESKCMHTIRSNLILKN